MRKKIRMIEYIPEPKIFNLPEGVSVKIISKAFKEAEDSCTAEGGKWLTIRGTHVCVKDGESPADAFKRTTGKDLDDGNTQKDINIPNTDNKTGKDKMTDSTKWLDRNDVEKNIPSEQQLQNMTNTEKKEIAHALAKQLENRKKDYMTFTDYMREHPNVVSSEEKRSFKQRYHDDLKDLKQKIKKIDPIIYLNHI